MCLAALVVELSEVITPFAAAAKDVSSGDILLLLWPEISVETKVHIQLGYSFTSNTC